MNFNVITATVTALILLGIFSIPGIFAAEEKERTDDGYCKDGKANHGDNNPSKSEFKKYLNKDICELVDCINDERCEGKIKDWSDFKETPAYESANVLMTDCFKDRYDLPPALQDYEIQKCGTGDY